MRKVNKYTYTPQCAEMHLLVEMIYRGRKFFKAKMYDLHELNMHIPPPVQAVLVQVLGAKHVRKGRNTVHIYDLLCIPGYENRIVISHPDYAIYDNEPMVIIEFENGNNYPTYKEIN